jgi:hypothetical protein
VTEIVEIHLEYIVRPRNQVKLQQVMQTTNLTSTYEHFMTICKSKQKSRLQIRTSLLLTTQSARSVHVEQIARLYRHWTARKGYQIHYTHTSTERTFIMTVSYDGN